MRTYLGFDIGGTKIEVMLIRLNAGTNEQKANENSFTFEFCGLNTEVLPAVVLDRMRTPTERHLGYTQIIEKMADLAQKLCAKHNIAHQDICGVGLSVPGPVDPKTKNVQRSNTMVVAGHNMSKDLKEKLGWSCDFASENDANCFALAEAYCGAGLKYFQETGVPISQQVGVGLILGSGFGGGIVSYGRILSGRRGGGGELGHLTLYANGHPCYCGRQGCAEQYLCGPALEALMKTRSYSQLPPALTAKEIYEFADKKDPVALAVTQQYQRDLAFYLGSVSCALDPHYFVMGGGLSLQKSIYDGLSLKIAQNTYLPEEPVHIYPNHMGDSAGAIGAIIPLENAGSGKT